MLGTSQVQQQIHVEGKNKPGGLGWILSTQPPNWICSKLVWVSKVVSVSTTTPQEYLRMSEPIFFKDLKLGSVSFYGI